MALIKVGIHENLVLTNKTKINDKGTLELSIAAAQSDNALFDAFSGDETFNEMESSFRFYPPNMKDFDGNKKTSAEIAKEVLRIRHQLIQYALIFGTKEEVSEAVGGLSMFRGLIAPEQVQQALTQFDNEDFTKKVVTNLSRHFLDFLNAKNAFSGEVKFRQKFLRQSKDKNYATISNSDFDLWIEPMDVPKEASKIAYSEYEKSKGKHLSHPISSSGSETSQEDVNKANSLFDAPDNTEAAAPQTEAAPPVTTTEIPPAQPNSLFSPE